MFDVAVFLMRWLFVTKLLKGAEIQTLPPMAYPPHEAWQVEDYLASVEQYHNDDDNVATSNNNNNNIQPQFVESVWRDHCVRNVLQYPPGTGRWQALEAYRMELVQRLSQIIGRASVVLEQYRQCDQIQVQQSHDSSSIQQQHEEHNNEPTRIQTDDCPEQASSSMSHHDNLQHLPPSTPQFQTNNVNDDPYWDTDVDLLREFEHSTVSLPFQQRRRQQQQYDRYSRHTASSNDDTNNDDADNELQHQTKKKATLVLSSQGANVIEDDSTDEDERGESADHRGVENNESRDGSTMFNNNNSSNQAIPTTSQVAKAHNQLHSIKQYLPQLVAAVLDSGNSNSVNDGDPSLLAMPHPVEKLRHLLLNRCVDDPSFGIELCWLLEAQVGRTWKTLLEHRQQSGRRLIVVLPAERAQIIAKIGQAKQHAFVWLQEVEQATAYGPNSNEHVHHHGAVPGQHSDVYDSSQYSENELNNYNHNSFINQQFHGHAKLPSSISLRRCKHFGDTMHFIDQLSELCLGLRHVAPPHRNAYLHQHLYDLNRRLRRRMVTRGDVTLDVDDHASSPEDWPGLQDLTLDMLQYSVHFPLMPQTGVWPDGTECLDENDVLPPPSTTPVQYGSANTISGLTVPRILNIVVNESRLLSSRERCPYLVHMEVADTGLEGSDARLYATGARNLGATTEEAMGITTNSNDDGVDFEEMTNDNQNLHSLYPPMASYVVPSELTRTMAFVPRNTRAANNDGHRQLTDAMIATGTSHQDYGALLSRGGWQYDGMPYYDSDEFSFMQHHTTREAINEEQLQQLHQNMQNGPQQMPPPPPPPPQPPASSSSMIERAKKTVKNELLTKVFGQPWIQKCRDIRETSPFGHVEGWRLASFIMKAGEDIRREALVMQVISKMRHWFETELPESARPYLRPYTIMCVGGDAGLVECLSDAKSIDELKKKADGYESLRDYFERAYGPPKRKRRGGFGAPKKSPGSDISPTFEIAQDNFLRSLVGYSLLCYALQIKDRHNANILIDRDGHIMHIDFGYVLGDTPKMGKVPLFSERAPFKLSQEFWDLLGGWNVDRGGLGVRFCSMFEKAFECLSAHADEIASLVEGTLSTLDPDPHSALMAANGIRHRLHMRGPPETEDQQMFVVDLINTALTSWGTSTYDWLQRNMNGYQ